MIPPIEMCGDGTVIVTDGEHAGKELAEILTELFTQIDDLRRRVEELEAQKKEG